MFAKELDQFNILKHEFYVAWERGELSKKDLQEYCCQYFNHVEETPRYLSTMHSNCKEISVRQVILDNLVDEEKGQENHPELWLRFCDALDLKRSDVRSAKLLDKTKELSDTFFNLANSSTAEGLGALYAYERQIPEVAKTKIKSLQKFYAINADSGSVKFFDVHIGADEWHSKECEDLIKALPQEEQQKAKAGAIKLAKAFWGFLDGMEGVRTSKDYPNC